MLTHTWQGGCGIAELVQLIRMRHDCSLLAVHVASTTDAHVDFNFPVEAQHDASGNTEWGGVVAGRLLGATRVYLGDEFRSCLSSIIAVGGGSVAAQELEFAADKLPCTFVRAEPAHPAARGRFWTSPFKHDRPFQHVRPTIEHVKWALAKAGCTACQM